MYTENRRPYIAAGTCVRVLDLLMTHARPHYGVVRVCFRSDDWRIVVDFPDGTSGTFGTEEVTIVSPLDPLAAI